MARDVATVLVDGDLMGHTTHGLALVPGYLAELEKGAMAKDGVPDVVAAHPAAQTWDGRRLPGPWLTLRALDAAAEMAAACGTGTVAIRRSHHIACLAAYLKRATDRGLMMLLACSDPAGKSVAPFGAVSPVYTPNPIAAGIPTEGEAILLDISASYTTNSLTQRLYKAGGKLPHAWVQDAAGTPTDDPAVLFNEPKGTLLPLGGLDAGHKGFALALLIEALTAGLDGLRPRRSVRGLGRDRVRAGPRSAGLRRPRGVPPADAVARRCVSRRDPAPRGRARAPARRARPGADAVASRGWRPVAPVDPARARAVGGQARRADPCAGLMHVMAGGPSLRHAFRQ